MREWKQNKDKTGLCGEQRSFFMDDFGKEWGISPKILTDFLVFSEKRSIPLKRAGDFVKIKLQRTRFADTFLQENRRGGIPMKKQKKWLLLGMALAGMIAMAGCGGGASSAAMAEGSAEEYVQAAKDALTEADSFTAAFTANVSMEGNGEMMADGNIVFVKEPLYAKVDTKMSFESMNQSYAIYLEKSEDAVNQYMNYDGQWTEMTMTEENALSSIQVYNTLENMKTILSAAENWAIGSPGDILTLTGTIPEAKVHAVESSGRFFQLAGMSGLSEVYFFGVGDVPVEITVDGKTGAPLSYKIDLTKALEAVTNNVLRELGGGTLEEGIAVKTHVISSTLMQLGGVTAEEIPPAAKSDAINYEKEISLLEETE